MRFAACEKLFAASINRCSHASLAACSRFSRAECKAITLPAIPASAPIALPPKTIKTVAQAGSTRSILAASRRRFKSGRLGLVAVLGPEDPGARHVESVALTPDL